MTGKNEEITRREAIAKLGGLLGGTLSASTLAALMGGCAHLRPVKHLENGYEARAFSIDDYSTIRLLAETILPRTDTPGALDAGVPEFIDSMLIDWYPGDEREKFLIGFEQFKSTFKKKLGKVFTQASEEQRLEHLKILDRKAFPDLRTNPQAAAEMNRRVQEGTAPFFRTLKELVVTGYYTSELGATQELRQNPMGVFLPDVEYQTLGRAWS